ncbi:MAG: TIGR03564 family F420-dependent LLM class oxidoreductase [Acidimicrobiia bacterium]|jgi:F420-dependent oxidoreductase-like protein
MRIGILGREQSGSPTPLADCIEDARRAAAEGFTTFWLPQAYGLDVMTALAVVGREVAGIELGTAVVPIYARTPISLASAVRTVQAAVGGRFTLGVGLSHVGMVQAVYGASFDHPVRDLREYLTALVPLLRGEPVDVAGESYRVAGQVTVQGVDGGPVLVAALGPQTLRVTGRLADGTIAWVTGPRTLEEHTIPTICGAAEAAGRPRPRIVAGLPVCVTADAPGARERADRVFQIYGVLPSYRAMLDREGARGPGDVAVVGDEDSVRAQLEHLAAIGVDDFAASPFGTPDERAVTRALLTSGI